MASASPPTASSGRCRCPQTARSMSSPPSTRVTESPGVRAVPLLLAMVALLAPLPAPAQAAPAVVVSSRIDDVPDPVYASDTPTSEFPSLQRDAFAVLFLKEK